MRKLPYLLIGIFFAFTVVQAAVVDVYRQNPYTGKPDNVGKYDIYSSMLNKGSTAFRSYTAIGRMTDARFANNSTYTAAHIRSLVPGHPAAGSTTQVQYNNNGVQSGAAYLNHSSPNTFIPSGGKLGIGTRTPSGNSLHIYSDGVATHTDILALNQVAGVATDVLTSTGEPPSGAVQAVNSEFLIKYNSASGTISNNFNTFRMIARTDTTTDDSFTAQLAAANFAAQHGGSATASTVVGFVTNTALRGTGNVTQAIAVKAATPGRSGTGTISQSIGVQVQSQKITGVTTGYGILQEGTGDINSFAGKTGIGTISPRAPFDNASSAAGKGKGYTGSSTNYAIISQDQGLRFAGTALQTNDIQFNLAPGVIGAGHPAMSTFLTPIEAYLWTFTGATGDHSNFAGQELPHWFYSTDGKTIGEFHLHWAVGTSNMTAGQQVRWQLDISCAPPTSSGVSGTFKPVHTFYKNYSASGTVTARSKIYSSFGNYTATSCAFMESQIIGRLQRIKPLRGADPSADPFTMQLGLHAYGNSIGSDQQSSKTATP